MMGIKGISGEDSMDKNLRGFPVGDLSDRGVASRIVALLTREGIVGAEVFFDTKHNRYIVTVAKKEDLTRSINIYRHGLGLPTLSESPSRAPVQLPMGKVTLILMAFSIGAWLLFRFELAREWLDLLYISSEYGEFLSEVKRGEVWRLVTPMFLHFNLLHILFNMLCLMQFGSIQENLMGRGAFLGFVLLASLFSNVFQYWETGPKYGGMSGVIFAQVGFLWCYKKCNPKFPHGLPKEVLVSVMAWFVLCLTGIFFFKMANIAHGVGLATGILLAIAWSRFQGIRPPVLLPVGVASGIVLLTYGAEHLF